MFFKKYGDIVTGIFFSVFSIVMILMAQLLPKSKVMDIGPDFMPTVVGVIMLILSVILLIQSIRSFNSNAESLKDYKDESDYKRMIMSLILCLFYVYLLQPVGFIITTFVYLILQITVLAPDENRRKKDIIKYSIISLIFTLAVFFLFRYGFVIVLPAGIFTISI
ncbi:tripartite tricarboxylate transporter TctB family protein [Lachnospiraceae bacterium C1.1]|nr:tripartite tricarboxylate transporter TctB family protein [Lachnospiraceae bacterium C1.1]